MIAGSLLVFRHYDLFALIGWFSLFKHYKLIGLALLIVGSLWAVKIVKKW